MKLRYTGPNAVTFHTAGVGEVEPGAEFTVPDELADAFTRRSDIEIVPDAPVAMVKVSLKKKSEPEPLPEAVEESPADTATP